MQAEILSLSTIPMGWKRFPIRCRVPIPHRRRARLYFNFLLTSRCPALGLRQA
jgi:hypothetical protein